VQRGRLDRKGARVNVGSVEVGSLGWIARRVGTIEGEYGLPTGRFVAYVLLFHRLVVMKWCVFI